MLNPFIFEYLCIVANLSCRVQVFQNITYKMHGKFSELDEISSRVLLRNGNSFGCVHLNVTMLGIQTVSFKASYDNCAVSVGNA
jgi:hypothetical protein